MVARGADRVLDAAEGRLGLVGNKTGATRLGFSLLLKFYEIEGCFPSYAEEVLAAAVDYMAGLVKVEPEAFAKYSWTDRQIKRHRKQIRDAFGTRPPTEADEEKWARWLAAEVCPVETSRDRLAEALLRRCRRSKVEPPAVGQVERIVASAARRHEEAFAAATVAKLGPGVCARILGVLAEDGLLAELKADPGPLGLDTLFAEIAKLGVVKTCSPRPPTGWWPRGGRERRGCSPRISPRAPSRGG
ncbi:MAG: DUF4158 domain-containing protein [Pseudonocardiaceae bacterium]